MGDARLSNLLWGFLLIGGNDSLPTAWSIYCEHSGGFYITIRITHLTAFHADEGGPHLSIQHVKFSLSEEQNEELYFNHYTVALRDVDEFYQYFQPRHEIPNSASHACYTRRWNFHLSVPGHMLCGSVLDSPLNAWCSVPGPPPNAWCSRWTSIYFVV